MTNRWTAAAVVVLLVAACPGGAWGQYGRGGMVGNRGNFGRPVGGFNPALVNRGGPNRPNVVNNAVRPTTNNVVVNNTTNIVNQTNINSNNNNNNRQRVGRPGPAFGFGGVGGLGGFGGPGIRGWGGPAALGGFGAGPQANGYYASHANWVNGSWRGNYRPGWGGYPGYGPGVANPGNSALGVGAAIGVAAWGLGSLVNSFGYARYSNPYLNPAATGYLPQPAVVARAVPFDYARPLDLASAPPQAVVGAAVANLDQARFAFGQGDLIRALALADKALAETPNDPMLHEFRAICLFAMRRYDEAAVPLYTVLSAGPGWDWTTLLGLYPSIEVYTAQLRALEAYCNASPRAASARFVLAVLYLTQGNTAAAATRFREVVALQPQDRLSAQLLAAIANDPASNPAVAQAAAAPPANQPEAPAIPTGPVHPDLFGTWTATPAEGVAIALTVAGDGRNFAWKVVEKGAAREFRGEATADTGVLALMTAEMPPMVGRVAWQGASRFNFRLLGATADDPGLTFAR